MMKPARKTESVRKKILEKLCKSVLSEQTETDVTEELAENGIEKLAENVKNPDDAAELINKMTKMIKTKKNNILMIAYHQGKIFKKFITDKKFINAVTKFEISRATINFKTAIVKFIDEYPKMRKSCISIYHLQNNFRIIKEVGQEHASEFQ